MHYMHLQLGNMCKAYNKIGMNHVCTKMIGMELFLKFMRRKELDINVNNVIHVR